VIRSCDKCRDDWSLVVCIDGWIYGPCDSDYCTNPCESYYECDCKCHKEAQNG
jgi:hypothetical protein